MQIICVDDEASVLAGTVALCEALPQKPQTEGFQSGADALDWLKTHDADIALLDIRMQEMDGLVLAKKIKGVNSLKDAEWIQKITECSEEDAMYYASVFAEVMAYQDFIKMMKLSGLTDENEARELIHQGFTVEKTAKVSIELMTEDE